jgi:CheY-like chemotaxis protein
MDSKIQDKTSDICALVVDDVNMNLYVAQELLTSHYEMQIETVSSGFEAIEKIKQGKVYDIIFMDHMMPGMDGIEATRRIRKTGYTRPIIALTASALVGQEEIFLKNGFDAFLSKPMDIQKVDKVLNSFVGDRKRITTDGEKVKSADDNSKKIAAIFLTDAQNSVDIIEKTIAKKTNFSDSEWRHFTVNVHAMKTALVIIGEKQLSATALKLELESYDRNYEVILADTPDFVKALKDVIEKMKDIAQIQSCDSKSEDKSFLKEKLQEFSNACDIFDKRNAKAILAELGEKVWSQGTNKLLDDIQRHLWDGNFEKAAKSAKSFSVK